MHRLTKLSTALFLAASVAACSGSADPAGSLEKARHYLEAGKTRAAAIELKNLLKADRNNGQARFLLGQINLRLGDAAGAEKELRLARQAGVADAEIQPFLAEAYLKQGKFDELLELDATNLPAEGRARVMAAQGIAMLAKNKKEDARKLIDQALEEFPTSPQAQAAKARLLAAENRLDDAIAQLNTTLAKHPQYADGWTLLGEIHQTAGNHQAAVRAFDKAIELKLNDFQERFNRAVNLVMLNKLEEARKDLDAIRRVSPQNSAVAYLQGLIDLGEQKLDDAKAQFEQAILSKSVNPMAFYLLGAINLAQGNIEQAQSYAERFLTMMPNNVAGRKLAARADLRLRQPEKVEMLLRPVVTADPKDAEAANMLATALLKMGRLDEATALLEEIAKANPESADAKAKLGAGLALQGRSDKAMEYFKKAVKLDPHNKRATVFMVLNLIRQGQADEAVATAEEYVKNNADDPSAWNLLGHARLAAHQKQQARQAFEKAVELNPGDPAALTTLARLAVADKDHAKARKLLEQILEHHPDHLGALMSLAILDAMEGKMDQMEARLEKAAEAHPKNPTPHLALARYYLEKGLPDQALTQLAPLDDKDRQSPAALSVLTRAYLQKKDYTSAVDTAESLVKAKPKSARAWFLLAQAHAGLGKEEALAEDLRKALERDPEYFQARAAYARLLLRQKRYDEVERELQKLRKLAPENPETIELEGALALARGEGEKGLAYYRKLFEMRPNTVTLLRLAAAEWYLKHYDNALKLLNDWVSEHPDDERVLMNLANSYLLLGKHQEAVEVFNKIIAHNPRSVVSLNNVAWYTRKEQPRKALELIEKAYTLDPDNVNVLDTYAMVLLANGEIQKARRMVERALDKTPLPLFRLHYARILAAAGEKEQAIAQLKDLLSGKTTPAEKKEGEELLRQLQGN